MPATTFDTLAYARKLEKAGFSREQAEIQAEALRDFAESQATAQELATKDDLRELELLLKDALIVRLGGFVPPAQRFC